MKMKRNLISLAMSWIFQRLPSLSEGAKESIKISFETVAGTGLISVGFCSLLTTRDLVHLKARPQIAGG